MKTDVRFALIRVPRLPINLYKRLSFSQDFNEELSKNEFREFVAFLKEEVSYLYDLYLKAELKPKHQVTILNYLMRMTTRCSPLGGYSTSTKLNLGEQNDYLLGKLAIKKRKVHEQSKLRKIQVANPAKVEVLNQTYWISRKGISIEEKENTVLDINLFERCEENRRSYLEISMTKSNINKNELLEIAKSIHILRNVNGNNGSKSFAWKERIRDELFRTNGPIPIPLLEAVVSFNSFRVNQVELLQEIQGRINESRHYLLSLINSEDDEVELKELDIQKLTNNEFCKGPNLSKDYSVIFSKFDDQIFVKYFRSNFRAIRTFAQEHLFYGNESYVNESNDNINYVFCDLISCIEKPMLRARPISTSYAVSIDGTPVPKDFTEIKLDDLYLYATGEDIILFSKKLNKRIVPVLTTSYLAENDNNILYRFLASIAKSNYKDGLYVDLSWAPLEKTPRITFKNIVLFPKTWKIKKSKISEFLMELPPMFRLVSGDKDALIYRDSPYALEQIKKSKDEILYIHEELGEGVAGHLYEIGMSYHIANKNEVLPFKIYSKEIDNSSLLQLTVNCPSGVIETVAKYIIENYFKETLFYFVSYPHPNSQLRFRCHKLKCLEIFEKLQKDTRLQNYMVALEPYRIERNTYGEAINQYIAASQVLSRHFLVIKKICNQKNLYALGGYGVLELIFQGFLAKFLLGEDILRFKDTPFMNEMSYSGEKQTFNFFLKNKNSIIMLRIIKLAQNIHKELNPIIKEAEGYFKNIGKEKNFFVLRLIHMEVFRSSMIPNNDINPIILKLGARLFRYENR